MPTIKQPNADMRSQASLSHMAPHGTGSKRKTSSADMGYNDKSGAKAVKGSPKRGAQETITG